MADFVVMVLLWVGLMLAEEFAPVWANILMLLLTMVVCMVVAVRLVARTWGPR